MGQRMTYHCDNCGCCINEQAAPVVLYFAAGHVNGGGELDAATVPPLLVKLLTGAIARLEFCVGCVGLGLKMGADGMVPSDGDDFRAYYTPAAAPAAAPNDTRVAGVGAT